MAYKATQSRAPAAPSMYKAGSDRFLGIDSSSSDDNISLSRACGVSYFDIENSVQQGNQPPAEEPGACNFIRTNIGEIGKRRGIKIVEVSGVQFGHITNYVYNDDMTVIFDCGRAPFGLIRMIILRLSENGYSASVYTLDNYADGNGNVATEDRVHSCTFCELVNNKLIAAFEPDRVLIADIKAQSVSGVYVSSSGVADLTENGREEFVNDLFVSGTVVSYKGWYNSGITVPRIYIGGSPAGGSGKGLEPVNLLCPYVCEGFVSDGSSTEYFLSAQADNLTQIYAFVLNDSGTWADKIVTAVNENGRTKVQFSSAPGAPPVSGEDSVRIYYRRKQTDFVSGLQRLVKCRLSATHGVGGYKDRLFLSGNDEYPNYVWYSEMDNYGYFSDRSYLTFSDRNCRVMLLAGQDTSLAVVTDGSGYLVSGTANNPESAADFEPDALFTVSRVFFTPKPAGFQRPAVFDNEILYMSDMGLCALSASAAIDGQYSAQIRSEYVNKWLLGEELDKCGLCAVGEFLAVSTNSSRMYVFDGSQYSQAPSKPFSYRQFEAYIFSGCAAQRMWRHGGQLYLMFGGKIGRLSFDTGANEDYIDQWNGEQNRAVQAYWETSNIFGGSFYNKKSFARLGLLIRKMMNQSDGREINTSVRIWYKKNNDAWKLLRGYNGDQCIFRYDYLNYALFSYRPTGKTYTVSKKIKIKKTYSLKLRFESDIEGMPLFLQAFGLEYTM